VLKVVKVHVHTTFHLAKCGDSHGIVVTEKRRNKKQRRRWKQYCRSYRGL